MRILLALATLYTLSLLVIVLNMQNVSAIEIQANCILGAVFVLGTAIYMVRAK